MSSYKNNGTRFGWGPDVVAANPEKLKLLNRFAQGSVIDLGCGSGIYSAHLQARGHAILGIDSEKSFIHHCRKSYPEIDFRQQNILRFKTKEKYDTALLFDILEHLDDNQLLTKVKKYAHRLIISVPRTNQEIMTKHALAHHHYLDRTHLRTYTPKSLRQLLIQHKLKIIFLEEVLPINLSHFTINHLSRGNPLINTTLKILLKPFRPEPPLHSTIFAVADRQ